ncbi:MAG: ABC transporter permease [Clostridiales bacterium]|nr:ABC transporter permease [Clostridiales bacterium]
MRKTIRWQKPLVIAAAGSLVAAIAFLLLALITARGLYDQRAAELWEAGGDDALSYAQVTVFLARDTGFNYDSLMKLRYDIDEKYIEDGISSPSESEDARLWTDAASAEGSVTAERNGNSINASVTAVTGDYFRFHPNKMMSGQYLNREEASKDVVLLDWNAAWRLFGGYDVAGMQVEVGGRSCIVGGVFEKDAEDGAENRVIVSYELYELMNSSAELGVLEFILPNTITDHGLQTVSELVGVSDENRTIIENTSRFKFKSLFKAATNFGDTIAHSKSIALPYYENRARVAEFRGGVFLLLAAVFAILPLTCVVMALVKIYRRRSGIWSSVKAKFKQKNTKNREHP